MKSIFALAAFWLLCVGLTLHQTYKFRQDSKNHLELLKVTEQNVAEQVLLKCRDDAIRECKTQDLPTLISGHPQIIVASVDSRRRLTETVPILPHWYIASDSCLEQAFREHRVGQPCAEVFNDLKNVREVQLEKTLAFFLRYNNHLSDLVSVYAVTFFAAIVLIVLKHRRDMMRAMEQGTTSSTMTWLSFLVLAPTYLLTVCTVSLSIPFWLVITFALTTFPVVVMLMFHPVHSKHDSTFCRSCETNADVNAGQTEEQACY